MKHLGGIAALLVVVAGCAWTAPRRAVVLDPPPNAGQDDTAWLQAELDAGGAITLPALADGRCYRVRGLWLTRSHTSLVSDGACLEALGPGPVRRRSGDGDPVPATAVLFVNREGGQPAPPSAVLLRGLRLVVPAGLGMHGVAIYGRDVRVEGLHVTGSPVDAVHVGGRAQGEFAEAVAIVRSQLEGAERNALSVAGVAELTVEDNLFAGAQRDPGAGIDLEPDNPDDPILGVRISSNTIRGNARSGILLELDTRSGRPLRADRIRIERNRILDNGAYGIEINGGQRDGRGEIALVGNVMRGNALGPLHDER